SPLQKMPLTQLCCGSTRVADLSPLRGMALGKLYCDNTLVSDIRALEGMPLTVLWCHNARVRDLSPLRGMPLRELRCDFKPERDADILRSIKTLETINEQPAADFWKAVDAGAAGAKGTLAQVTLHDQDMPFVVAGENGARPRFKTLAEALRG